MKALKAHVRRGWVRFGLAAVGFGGEHDGAVELGADPDLAGERQVVRELLQTVAGSSTGARALDVIEAAVGRRTVVLHLSAEELGRAKRALEAAARERAAPA